MSTIITKRQFPNYHKYDDGAGRPSPDTWRSGKLAELANAAVMVGYGDTTRAGAASPPPPVPGTASTSSP